MYYLKNEKYEVEFEMDDQYSMNSADNPFQYDKVFNPYNFKNNNFYKTLSVTVDDGGGKTRLALIGDFFTYDISCAVMNGSVLTVLLNKYLVFINLENCEVTEYRSLGILATNYSIDPCKYGYLIYGEISIVLLDFDFNVKWHFDGADIFVSISGHVPFSFNDEKIMLYDFLDNYYELDYDGNLLNKDNFR